MPTTLGLPTTAPAILSGLVFVDTNGNNIRDPGELVAPGVNVNLVGTTLNHHAVNVTTTTKAQGTYTFFQVQPGTYSLILEDGTTFVGGSGAFGNLGGQANGNVISGITVAAGQAGLNYNLAVRGLAPTVVSLRQFLSDSTSSSIPLPAAGPGVIAVDGTVNPLTKAASAGTSSLAGSVLNDSNALAPIAGVKIALTGIDNFGRDVFLTTTTDSGGAYSFNNLQPGAYTIDVLSQPGGFRADLPTVGSQGGQVLRNDQITNIQLGSGITVNANGTGYNFGELALPTPVGSGLTLTAGLANDTAGVSGSANAGTTSDGITADPSIVGRVLTTSRLTSLSASFGSHFTGILGQVTAGGNFYLNPALLQKINGGPLANGSTFTLHLHASDAHGRSVSFNVSFTLEDAAPLTPTLQIQGSPTLNGTSTVVNVGGTTSKNVTVELFQGGTMIGSPVASDPSTGNFTFSNVTLQGGANTFTVQAIDNAGNSSQLTTFLVNPIALTNPTAQAETLTAGPTASSTKNDLTVNLGFLFTDPNTANSQVTFNTSAGPINVQLLDNPTTGAPMTVSNFFDYINAGAYNNDIFHRNSLSNPNVLQGGGFTFKNGVITPVKANPPVPNEFSASNLDAFGTLAMAKQGGNPNSATSQFFFNTGDNSTTLNGSNNGGFTVFGKVASPADQRVLNTLDSIPIKNESKANGAFNTLPLQNYTGTNFPADASAGNFALIHSISQGPRADHLTFSVTSNTDATKATATINNDLLVLHPLAAGSTTITITATDQFGGTATVQFTITVNNPVTVTNPGSQNSTVGQAINLPITATDANHSTLTYSATELPPGLVINPHTGKITGTITSTTGSPLNTMVTATDAGGFHASQTFTWTIS